MTATAGLGVGWRELLDGRRFRAEAAQMVVVAVIGGQHLVRAQVIVSLDDHPIVRRAFCQGFEIEEVETISTVAGSGQEKPITELIIQRG